MSWEPIQTAEDLINWIDRCVLGDLRTLQVGIDQYESHEDHFNTAGAALGGANFLLGAGCCMAIEYFGHILVDGAEAREAKALRYVRQFITPICPRYAGLDLLLWQCLRQGTVHRNWPKRIEVEGHGSIVVAVGNTVADVHLERNPDREVVTFSVSAAQLLTDLDRSVQDRFIPWIREMASPDAIHRANPEPLPVKASNTELFAQARHVVSWYTQAS